MNEQRGGTEPVECVEIVYRALKRKWIQGLEVPADAFFRRVPTPTREAEEALSLCRAKYATARDCRQRLTRMPACASLHTGKVRALPFGPDIYPDPIRDENGIIVDRAHCVLVNLPDQAIDPEAAEFAASQLARIARLVTEEQEEEEQRRWNTAS
jgi:hypothetical protein